MKIPASPNSPLHTLDPKNQPRESGRFAKSLTGAVAKVNQDHQDANQAIQDLATGRRKTLHETMIQVEKAEISFRLLMAVRGKLVNAYQEVMRMHF